jgi:hypothetical protein
MENRRQREFVKAMHRQPLGRSKQKSEEAKSSQKAGSDSSEDPLNIATRPKSPIATLEARKPFKNPMKAMEGREKRDESKGVVPKRLTRKQAMEEDTRRRAQSTHRLTTFSSGQKPKDVRAIDQSNSSSSQAPAGRIARPNSSYAATSRADRTDEDVSSSSKQSASPNADDSERHLRTRPASPPAVPKPFPMDEDENPPLLSRGTSPPDATEPAGPSFVSRTPSPLRRKAQEERQPFPMSPTTPLDSTRMVKRGSSLGQINDAVSFKRPKYDEESEELSVTFSLLAPPQPLIMESLAKTIPSFMKPSLNEID